MKKNYFLLPVLSATLVLFFFGQKKNVHAQTESKFQPADVLIVYSYGTPYKTITDLSAEDIDAITTATPTDINTKTIAEKIEVEFRFKGYKTRLASTEEISGFRDILNYNMVVLGTGARFWNMSWEMKRMIDVHLGNIYIAYKDQFKKQVVGAFAQAEYAPSADRAIKSIGWATGDCGNPLSAEAIFLTSNNMPQDSLMARIKVFVAAMEEAREKKKAVN